MTRRSVIPLELYRDYPSSELRTALSLDGPCLMDDRVFALVISLRGKDAGAMPTPVDVHWGRDVPNGMRAAPVRVLLRRADGARYVGLAAFVRDGHLGRDGFRVLFRLTEPVPEPMWRELVAEANAPPPPDPVEGLAALTVASSVSDRVAAMRTFVDRWYGPAVAGPVLPASVPAPLRPLYELAAGREMFAQNRLVPAHDVALAGEMLTFYVENQGVCAWAIEAQGADPAVFVRGASGADRWVLEALSLSAFALQVAIYEATFAAPFAAGSDGLSAYELKKLERRVTPLRFPPWQASATKFLASNGMIGTVTPSGDQYDVRLAAHQRAPFEAIETLVEDWPEIGF